MRHSPRTYIIAAVAATVLAVPVTAVGVELVNGAPSDPQNPELKLTASDGDSAGRVRKNEADSNQSLAGDTSQSLHPCGLVSAADAQGLLGGTIDATEAPQGPTCIYRNRSGSDFLTLAVHALNVEQLEPQLKDMDEINVAGQSGYCGKSDPANLFILLKDGRLLSIGGESCDVERGFAAKALPQLLGRG
jgi:hypothetical protein